MSIQLAISVDHLLEGGHTDVQALRDVVAEDGEGGGDGDVRLSPESVGAEHHKRTASVVRRPVGEECRSGPEDERLGKSLPVQNVG